MSDYAMPGEQFGQVPKQLSPARYSSSCASSLGNHMPFGLFHPNAGRNWFEVIRIAAMVAFWRCSKAGIEIAWLYPDQMAIRTFMNGVD